MSLFIDCMNAINVARFVSEGAAFLRHGRLHRLYMPMGTQPPIYAEMAVRRKRIPVCGRGFFGPCFYFAVPEAQARLAVAILAKAGIVASDSPMDVEASNGKR